MKIILCTFLLCITAYSVFSESRELHGIVGKSVELTYAVKPSGGLLYSGETIGDVTSGSFKTSHIEKYKGRVQWDSSTGYFSLSGLRLNDSGVYNVQNDGQKSVSFSLTVWKDNVPVSKPHVKFISDIYPCFLLCTVERGTGATLDWYREGEGTAYGSYPPRSAPDLYLSVRVDKRGSYTCEAKNSVGSETSDPLTVGAHCTGGAAGIWQAERSKMWSLCLVLIAMLYSRLV